MARRRIVRDKPDLVGRLGVYWDDMVLPVGQILDSAILDKSSSISVTD